MSSDTSNSVALRMSAVLDDKPSIAELTEYIAFNIGIRWRALGIELGVDVTKIEEIDQERHDCTDKAMFMLYAWLQTHPKANRSQVIEALKSIREHKVANDYKKAICGIDQTFGDEDEATSSNEVVDQDLCYPFYLPTKPQANGELHVEIPEPPHPFHELITRLRRSYGLLFEKVYDELTLSMENTRENINVISLRLGRIFPELKRKLSKAKSIEDILIIVRSQCNLTDVTRLTTIKVDQLSADVSAYKSEMKTACRILHRSVKDNLSQYQHLIFKLTEAENVKDITDAENVKDILALLRKSFLSEIPRVSLCVKSSKVSYTMVAVGGHSFILIIAVDFIIIVVIIWNYWKNDADASSKQTDTQTPSNTTKAIQASSNTSSEASASNNSTISIKAKELPQYDITSSEIRARSFQAPNNSSSNSSSTSSEAPATQIPSNSTSTSSEVPNNSTVIKVNDAIISPFSFESEIYQPSFQPSFFNEECYNDSLRCYHFSAHNIDNLTQPEDLRCKLSENMWHSVIESSMNSIATNNPQQGPTPVTAVSLPDCFIPSQIQVTQPAAEPDPRGNMLLLEVGLLLLSLLSILGSIIFIIYLLCCGTKKKKNWNQQKFYDNWTEYARRAENE